MAAAFLLFLFLSAATSAIAGKTSEILVPSVLNPGTNSSVWLSDSGIFAFGFYETPKGYAICIFFAGISQKTVVWTANKFDPILPNNVVSLSIEDEGLVIWHNSEKSGYSVYDQVAFPEGTAATAAMLDSGNFVIYDSEGGVIWQSFDHPTHALLPGQSLRSGQELVSRASDTDLAIGKFRLKMQTDGNLVQYPVSTADTGENAYYVSGTWQKGRNLSLNLESDGRLYLDGNGDGGPSYDLTGGGGGGGVYLARVDPDGIFRLYNRTLARGDEWRSVWRSTAEECKVKGICGANTFCTSYENMAVDCTCLPGFGDGCREAFDEVECHRSEKRRVRYEMKRMRNVTWTDNYYEKMNEIVSEEECAVACVEDCKCVVAFFDEGKCRKQRLPLRYGVRSTGVSNTALVRVTLPSLPAESAPAPAPPQSPDGSAPKRGISGSGGELPVSKQGFSNMRKYMIIGVPIGIAVLVISSITIYYLIKRGRFSSQDVESKQNVKNLLVNNGSLAPRRYNYKEIKKITKSFTEKLGQGGYGVVYKGKLPDGKLVAIKVLKETRDNAEEFINEVASISRTSHVNIVNLLGFCSERKKRALVYEFMPNKSLDKFIYKSGSANVECSLEWNKLYEIAVGVARGLEYLHKGCNTRIIHFDIKPQNILLDQHFRPKISDFGLAKLCMRTQSVISMLGTRGTIGYIAPEVFSRNFGVVSHKSDVYSYGIMLLQMAEARTNVEAKPSQSCDVYFLEKIYEHILVQNEKIYALMKEEEEEAARKMLMVGFWCIQTAPPDRPSMNKVVDMLEGNLQSIQIPPLPFLLSSPKPQPSCLQIPGIVETQSSTN